MDKKQNEEGKLIPDDCSCDRGKLHKRFTKYVVEIEKEVVVISNVPAWLCDLCDESYISPEVSEKIDEIVKSFRAGKLLAKPLAAGQVELKMNA
jgi:YgiT-type zinc finger domain-containing protein